MSIELTRRRVVAGTGVAVLGASLAGCSGDGGSGGGQPTVEMTDSLVFDPEEITVSVDETVIWENVGGVAHSVTAYEDDIPDGAEYFASGGYDSEEAARSGYSAADPESGAIQGGESYQHTFEVAGTYEYFCIPHESTMTGTVRVEE
jgi:plastocyanin